MIEMIDLIDFAQPDPRLTYWRCIPEYPGVMIGQRGIELQHASSGLRMSYAHSLVISDRMKVSLGYPVIGHN